MQKIAKAIIGIIVWSCILTGSVLVTRFCIWYMSGLDITSVLLGIGIIAAVWLTVSVELTKTVKVLLKAYRIFKIKQARKHIIKYGN